MIIFNCYSNNKRKIIIKQILKYLPVASASASAKRDILRLTNALLVYTFGISIKSKLLV